MTESFTLTADALCNALWGEGVESVNKGTYKGTNIPLRPIAAGAVLRIEDHGVVTVTDDLDGWIADRICDGVLGRREFNRVKASK